MSPPSPPTGITYAADSQPVIESQVLDLERREQPWKDLLEKATEKLQGLQESDFITIQRKENEETQTPHVAA